MTDRTSDVTRHLPVHRLNVLVHPGITEVFVSHVSAPWLLNKAREKDYDVHAAVAQNAQVLEVRRGRRRGRRDTAGRRRHGTVDQQHRPNDGRRSTAGFQREYNYEATRSHSIWKFSTRDSITIFKIVFNWLKIRYKLFRTRWREGSIINRAAGRYQWYCLQSGLKYLCEKIATLVKPSLPYGRSEMGPRIVEIKL